MDSASFNKRWQRRAQPLLGTLVEIGVAAGEATDHTAVDAAFSALRDVQDSLSRFEPHSDVARFNAMRAGERIVMRADTRQVLAAARTLRDATDGAFDITLGSAPQGWHCEGALLHKLDDAAHIDLGGIGKGHAVDRAVQALLAHGVASGWVNAGGDLRSFGDVDLPVQLRDEAGGGVRSFAMLRDGAFATSHFDRRSRSRLVAGALAPAPRAHVSVAAPLCLWADALTKIVALSGDTSHPLLARFGACAWWH
jgi:FAD:protein FMN transferase